MSVNHENDRSQTARRRLVKARSDFIWEYGVLRFGLPVAAFSVVLHIWELDLPMTGRVLVYVVVSSVSKFALLSLGGGYLFGAMFWWWSQGSSDVD